MKSTKVFLVLLCAALCVAAVSCASSGGAKASSVDLSSGTPIVATFEGSSDIVEGGLSTSTLDEVQEGGMTAWHFYGEIKGGGAIQWPWAGLELTPDEASMALLKTAKAISFKVKGNGKKYTFRTQVSNVTDYAWHGFDFEATAEPSTVTVETRMLMQPSWGQYKKLNLDNLTILSFGVNDTHTSYDFTVWDFQVHN